MVNKTRKVLVPSHSNPDNFYYKRYPISQHFSLTHAPCDKQNHRSLWCVVQIVDNSYHTNTYCYICPSCQELSAQEFTLDNSSPEELRSMNYETSYKMKYDSNRHDEYRNDVPEFTIKLTPIERLYLKDYIETYHYTLYHESSHKHILEEIDNTRYFKVKIKDIYFKKKYVLCIEVVRLYEYIISDFLHFIEKHIRKPVETQDDVNSICNRIGYIFE